jgi:transcriptional regulator with XRE-family HTH domain
VELLSAAAHDEVVLEPRKQFAANLLAARRRSGLTQEALGFSVGLHRTEVSLLERAGRDPRLETIAKLARGLGIPASELLHGIE